MDAFPMKDGKLAAESSTQPYENRDPRFYCTILHNGSRWLGKTLATYQGELITRQVLLNIHVLAIICVSLWEILKRVKLMEIIIIYG